MNYFLSRSLMSFLIWFFSFANIAISQFPIQLPKIPKIDKPTSASTPEKPSSTETSGVSPRSSSAPSLGKHLYENQEPTDIPVVIQPLVFIQAVNTNAFWKMPNARDVTSWIPEINVHLFWRDRSPLQTLAEFYNPDGSLWFTESLQTSGKLLRSNETWTLIDTKSTNGSGVYSVKIKNKATGAVLFAGKFRVNKFPASFNAADKNKLGFYVDHDWLVPMATVSFANGDPTQGLPPYPAFSLWLKGDVDYSTLEAQLFHNGRQVATKKATSGMAYDERLSKFTVPFDMGNILKRWQFTFGNVVYENGNDFNREYYQNTHWMEKNPGQYTFKLFRNGTQIREFAFTVGSDGRIVRPPYSDAFTFQQHGVLFPAKVMGNTEKWNPASARTDMFYGNPIVGFSIQ